MSKMQHQLHACMTIWQPRGAAFKSLQEHNKCYAAHHMMLQGVSCSRLLLPVDNGHAWDAEHRTWSAERMNSRSASVWGS